MSECFFEYSTHTRCSVHPQLNGVGGPNGYECGLLGPFVDILSDIEKGAETVMDTWLSLPSVQAALHVKPNTKGQSYRKTAGNLLPLYRELIAKYRMLIYSGDTDGCVPYVGSEQWTGSQGFVTLQLL